MRRYERIGLSIGNRSFWRDGSVSGKFSRKRGRPRLPSSLTFDNLFVPLAETQVADSSVCFRQFLSAACSATAPAAWLAAAKYEWATVEQTVTPSQASGLPPRGAKKWGCNCPDVFRPCEPDHQLAPSLPECECSLHWRRDWHTRLAKYDAKIFTHFWDNAIFVLWYLFLNHPVLCNKRQFALDVRDICLFKFGRTISNIRPLYTQNRVRDSWLMFDYIMYIWHSHFVVCCFAFFLVFVFCLCARLPVH